MICISKAVHQIEPAVIAVVLLKILEQSIGPQSIQTLRSCKLTISRRVLGLRLQEILMIVIFYPDSLLNMC